VQGTVLGREMRRRRIRQARIIAATGVSARALQNYSARRARWPSGRLIALCDVMDMDDEELVDADGHLRLAPRRKDQDDDW
jgi:hypothetical protein